MSSHAVKQSSEPVEPEEVQQQLEKILNSKYFVNAHKKKRFLRLICDFYLQGRAHELNEYILGYDVFDRDSKYNPSDDPVVRVTAHEIRKKLEQYYLHEGANDTIRLEIPAGSYQPLFAKGALKNSAEIASPDIHTTAPIEVEHAHVETESGQQRLLYGILAMGIVALALMIVVVVLSISNRELRQKVTPTNAANETINYGEVWGTFFESNSPPLVILSNPPALHPSNASDPETKNGQSIALSPEAIKVLEGTFVLKPKAVVRKSSRTSPDNANSNDKDAPTQNDEPRLVIRTNVYTGMGEAIALHYLTDFFRTADRSIQLKQSRTLSAEDIKNHNVILLGGLWANEWAGKLMANEDFVFTGNGTVENRNPQQGEEREYVPQFDSQTSNLLVDYALITVRPNISDKSKVMTLAGIYSQGTEAAAEFVTNKDYLSQLNQSLQQLKQQGKSSQYYQVLLKVAVENGIPTTITIVALHELRPS